MKISSIVTTVFVFFAIVLTIISMATYWEHTKISNISTGNNGESFSMEYFMKFDKIKVSIDQDGVKTSVTSSIPQEYKDAMKHSVQIHSAAFAFCVLAFVFLVFTFVISASTMVPGLSEKVPSIFSLVGKITMIASLIFCLISMLVFLGISNARYQDCKSNAASAGVDDDTACPKESYFKDFAGSIDNGYAFGEQGSVSWGPSTAWITIVIASFCALVATIVSFVGRSFSTETSGN